MKWTLAITAFFFAVVSAACAGDTGPSASLELPPVFEPAEGPMVARGALVLSQASAAPVTFKWQTADGTARGGADFVAASGEVTIPAGSLSAPLEVTILPDSVAEKTETLKVSVTQIAGAQLTESPALWIIRDTDRPAVVLAEDVICAEGGPPVNAVVKLYPAGESLTVGVQPRAPVIADFAGPVTDFGYAVPGVDWAGTPAVFSASPGTPGFGLLPLTGTQDTTEDGNRRGLLRFELPESAVAASFSERLVQEPQVTSQSPYTTYESISTDGKWAAALRDTFPERSILIYRRQDGLEGDWRLWTVLTTPALDENAAGSFLKLRGGRLMVFSGLLSTTRIFRPGPEGGEDRQWVQEAVLDPVPDTFSGITPPTDFDGETVVFAPGGSQLVLANRGAAGDWKGRQMIGFSGYKTAANNIVMEEGRLALAEAREPSGATIRFLERAGNGPVPWRQAVDSRLELPGGFNRFRVSGNVLTADGNVYRRRDDSVWIFEQRISDFVVRMSRGLIIGMFQIHADVGPPGSPWVAVRPLPEYLSNGYDFDSNTGVVISRSGSSASVLRIMEAGLGFSIGDRETFKLNADPVEVPEPRYAETSAVVSISTESVAPTDISITFETVADGSATPDLDYRPVKGTVIIPAGTQKGSFAIPILPDSIPEGNETIQVNLSAPSFGKLTASSVTVTIQSFAIVPFTRPPVFVPEPVSGEAVYEIPVNFSPASSTEVTAAYRIAAGTAGAADALLTQEGTVTIPAGMQTVLIPVKVYADDLTEEPETLSVSLRKMEPFPISPLTFEVTIDDRASGGSEPDRFNAPQNTGIDFDSARNVLANDTSGNTRVVSAREPMHGTVTWQEDGTFRYLPAANFIGQDRFAYSSRRLVLPAGTIWKWLNSSNGRDPGETVAGFQANWMKPDFDAASWKDGKGLMAYGAIGQGWGAMKPDTFLPQQGIRYTVYFRATLNFAEEPVEGVSVEFICDDAAIFYLNGVEMGRFFKQPAGAFASAPDTYTLLAPSAMNDDEESRVQRLYFPAARFKAGENVIAVSLHNADLSSDLGLKVIGISPGKFSTPTWVTMDVTDGNTPPVLQDDLYAPPATDSQPRNSSILDSRLIRSSVYSNDGLLADNGTPYDPILEVEIGGNAAGTVDFEKNTGHFRMAAPRNFYGTTGFTYRVRDKDGWSNTAKAVINVPPSRAYDQWRAAAFGADSFAAAGLPEMDEDADGNADVFEYVFRRDPAVPDAPEPLRLAWNGYSWEISFTARSGFGDGATLKLESASSLSGGPWTWLASINDFDYQVSLNRMSPGVTYRAEYFQDAVLGYMTRHTMVLPPGTSARHVCQAVLPPESGAGARCAESLSLPGICALPT